MKKKTIRALAILLAAVLIAGLSACSPAGQTQGSAPAAAAPASPAAPAAPAQKTYAMKFGHVTTVDNPTNLGAKKLAENLEAAAPGKWDISIYPDSQLGGAAEMTEAVQMGTLEISAPASSFVVNFAPAAGVWDMPFLFRDEEHVDKVADGEIGKSIGAELEKANMKFLNWWEVGFRCLANNKRPINTVDDIKGMRIRVMSNEIHQALFSALGVDPVPMSLADAYVANQQGTIDGQDNPLSGLYSISIFEICKYITVTKHVYTPQALVLSVDAWNSMTPDDQKIFTDCANQATQYQRQELRRQDNEAAKNLEAKGCELTYPDPAAFAEKMSVVYAKYPQYADIIKKIQAV